MIASFVGGDTARPAASLSVQRMSARNEERPGEPGLSPAADFQWCLCEAADAVHSVRLNTVSPALDIAAHAVDLALHLAAVTTQRSRATTLKPA